MPVASIGIKLHQNQPHIMSILRDVLTSSNPVATLRYLWSSLGTTVFLESVSKSLREAVQKRTLQKLKANLETKVRRSLFRWHYQANTEALVSNLVGLKALTGHVHRETNSHGTNGRAFNGKVKTSTKEALPADEGGVDKRLHNRSISQIQGPPALTKHLTQPPALQSRQAQPQSLYSKCLDNRPRSTDYLPKRPAKENTSLISKLRTERKNKANRGGKSDVGTRLFNKAQELAKKKELLKLCYTPEYSFMPKLNTDRGQFTRACKDHPKEEVAVVSSSIGLSFSRGGDSVSI
jgi:hypothetical protein